jgi:hypothetical protein
MKECDMAAERWGAGGVMAVAAVMVAVVVLKHLQLYKIYFFWLNQSFIP